MDISQDDRKHLQSIVKHFEKTKSKEQIFYDLCFCICAPQTKFVNNRKVINKLMDLNYYKFDIPTVQFKELLKPVRFFNSKARFLTEAKESYDNILESISEITDEKEKRKWLVTNVNGLGMKASSHFLRNLGAKYLAIIDVHIIKFMKAEQPKSKTDYLNLEEQFIKSAAKYQLLPVELDALIWKRYSNTDWEKFDF